MASGRGEGATPEEASTGGRRATVTVTGEASRRPGTAHVPAVVGPEIFRVRVSVSGEYVPYAVDVSQGFGIGQGVWGTVKPTIPKLMVIRPYFLQQGNGYKILTQKYVGKGMTP